jgi:hypothetical protein
VASLVADDLTTDPAVHPFRDAASAECVHPRPGNPQFIQNWMEKVLQHIAKAQRISIAGLENVSRGSSGQVLVDFCHDRSINRHVPYFVGFCCVFPTRKDGASNADDTCPIRLLSNILHVETEHFSGPPGDAPNRLAQIHS